MCYFIVKLVLLVAVGLGYCDIRPILLALY